MTPEEIAALVASTVTEMNKPILAQFTSINTALEALKKTPEVKTPEVKTPEVKTPEVQTVSPEVNSQLAEFKRQQEASAKQIEALTKANEDAGKRVQEAEKKSAVDAAMNGFTFATPEARATAFDKLSGEVRRTDDGALVAGDNLTPEAFAKTFFVEKHPYVLAPEVRGGSGASTGNVQRGGKVATLEMMSPDNADWAKDRALVAGQINAVLADLAGKK